MKSVTIASFNLHNHYWDNNWDGGKFPEALANFIKENKIDYLGVQELVRKYSFNLEKNLGKDYKIIGKYRFDKIPFTNRINESTAIITKEKVLNSKTKYLALFPILSHGTAFPRIFTTIQTKDIFLINTHIEYWKERPKRRQLKVLYKYILKNKDKKPIIIGDFNLELEDECFKDFIVALQKLDINMVPNTFKTHKNKTIDYIFIPACYEIEDFKVISGEKINNISDHHPILVKIKRKNFNISNLLT